MDKRRVGQFNDLYELVQVLFEQTAMVQTQYRRKCMRLFDSLAPCLAGTASSSAWVKAMVDQSGVDAIVNMAEGAVQPPVATYDALVGGSTLDITQGVAAAQQRINRLSTAIDFYVWAFRRGHLQPDVVFESPQSHLLNGVATFLADFAVPLSVGSELGMALLLSPSESDRIARDCAVLACRWFALVAGMFAPSTPKRDDVVSAVRSAGLLGTPFHRLSCLAILDPAAVGLDTVDSQAGRHVPAAAKKALTATLKVCTAAERGSLVRYLGGLLSKPGFDLRSMDLGRSLLSGSRLNDVVRAYTIFHEVGILADALDTSTEDLAADLGQSVFDLGSDASPVTLQVASGLLQLACNLGWAIHGHDSMLTRVLDATPVATDGAAALAPGSDDDLV